jgi:hypothetical protein
MPKYKSHSQSKFLKQTQSHITFWIFNFTSDKVTPSQATLENIEPTNAAEIPDIKAVRL